MILEVRKLVLVVEYDTPRNNLELWRLKKYYNSNNHINFEVRIKAKQ